MAMPSRLGSTRNVQEALELLDVIETTLFELFDASCRSRSRWHMDYYPGWTGVGAAFFYYDAFARETFRGMWLSIS